MNLARSVEMVSGLVSLIRLLVSQLATKRDLRQLHSGGQCLCTISAQWTLCFPLGKLCTYDGPYGQSRIDKWVIPTCLLGHVQKFRVLRKHAQQVKVFVSADPKLLNHSPVMMTLTVQSQSDLLLPQENRNVVWIKAL